jgi:hypothetical protein
MRRPPPPVLPVEVCDVVVECEVCDVCDVVELEVVREV